MKIGIRQKVKNLLNFKSPVLAKFGLEKALLNSFGAKAVAALFGPLQIILIMRHFSAEMQGYYYTFNSLLTFQVFLELGLGSIITYFASHEWSLLKYDKKLGVIGNEQALKRLVSFARLIFKWYFFAALFLFLILSFGGFLFFDLKETIFINWKMPWLMISLINSLIFLFVPIWALLEGCSQQNEVAYYRFIYSLIWGSVNCLCIFLGANLWVNVVSLSLCLIWNVCFLKMRFFAFFKTFLRKELVIKIPWKKEILPMQWRIAVSYISSFVAFNLFNPIIFYFFGSVMAGKIGLLLFLVGVITNFSIIYLNSYLPLFGTLLAKNKNLERDALFFRVFWITVGLCLIGSLGFICVVHLGRFFGFYIFNVRMISSPVLEYFVIGNFLSCIGIPFSVYLRSYKTEPLLSVSVVTAFLIASFLIFYSYQKNLELIALSYLFVNLFSLSWIILLWKKFKKQVFYNFKT